VWKKFCPLKQIKIKQQVNEERTVFSECIGEECAWYIADTHECALNCIATRLEGEIAITQRQIPLNPDC
jgi:hypothetical protein